MMNENKKTLKRDKGRRLKVLENLLFILFMTVIVALILTTVRTRIMGKEPSLLSHRLYIVDSGSMSPTLKLGALIIVKEAEPKEILKDDIITYRGSGDSVVTHRVTKIEDEGSTFITKGDANKTADPIPLDSNRLIGKVMFSIPYIGFLLKLIRSKVGFILIATLILVGIIVQILEIKKAKKNRDYSEREVDEGDTEL